MTGCTCEQCVAACANRPCWGTPEDIGKLLDLGMADRLMLDWWVGGLDDDADWEDVYIIAPACQGHEGDKAPEMGLSNFGSSFGRCVFLADDDRCEIHEHKPREGREAYPCQAGIDHGKLHKDVARTWDTDEGRLVVLRWKQTVGYGY